MPVIYNGKKIIPGPFVSITKNYIESGGELIGQTYQIRLVGKIVAYKGSPNSSGTFWTASGYPPDETVAGDSRLAAIERKIEALKKLFKDEGYLLEWASDDGSTPLSCNPRIKGMTFQEGPWFQTCDYTIELEADQLYGTADPDDFDDFIIGDTVQVVARHIESYSENWSVKENWDSWQSLQLNEPIFEITHTISAKGKRHYETDRSKTKQPWEWAKDFCVQRATSDAYNNNEMNVDVLENSHLDRWGIPSTSLFYTGRSEDIDEAGGQYTYTETLIAATQIDSQAVIGNVSVSCTRGAGGISVSVTGECKGLGKSAAERIADAESFITDARIYAIAANWVNGVHSIDPVSVTLNSQYVNKTITKNITGGTISFSYEYNDRHPHYLTDFAGRPSLTEDYSFTYSGGTPSIAEVFCLGRGLGPIMQDLGTITTKIKTLNINALMRRSSGGFAAAPDVDIFVVGYRPIQVDGAIQDYITNKSQTWNPSTGQFNFTVTWNYQ